MLDIAQDDTKDMISVPVPTSESRFRLAGTKNMVFSEWIDIPDCPFQRDTAAHAKKAHHLQQFSELHKKVTVAVLPNGDRYKVDGHTRAYCWSRGMTAGLPSPLVLSVDIFKCDGRDIGSLGALYNQIDNSQATMTMADVAHSAANELSLSFKSPMLRADRYGTAVKFLYALLCGLDRRNPDPAFAYKAIGFFKTELLLLDATSPKQLDYPGAMLMAAIITFMKYGDGASEFWTRYGENKGNKTDNEVDGVLAARNLLSLIKEKKWTGSSYFLSNIGRAINAFERYRDNENYTGKSGYPEPKKESELKRYLELAKRARARR